MKTVGLLGGTSWESTLVYYRLLNELTKEELGETHSCPLLLYSFDFAPLRELSFTEQWQEIGELMREQAQRLQGAGAECILICANTMHRVADHVQAGLRIPVINLVNAIESEAKRLNIKTVGVLGTRFTMQGDFYVGRLARNGVSVITPSPDDQAYVHAAIYDEMVLGQFNESTQARIAEICEQMVQDGAEGVVLGCTELPMLLKPEACSAPFLDTTFIHCQAAVAFALATV